MPQASPAKWHLAHTTWFFETFVLQRWEPHFKPHDASFGALFNSYYQSMGPPFARPLRGLLTRPTLAQVLAWRDAVDQRLLALLHKQQVPEQAPATPASPLHAMVTLGLHHEQQHQELLLTDIKHLFSRHPALPAYQASPPSASELSPQATAWLQLQGGLVETGHQGPEFCFDNELPRHPSWLAPYEIATQPVNNAQWCQFIEAGGYQDPQHWLAEGWDWLGTEQRTHPLYWHRMANTWSEFTLGGRMPLDPARPVSHVSYFEADAYARWAGARLPTEQEWEHAAHWVHTSQTQAHRWALHPPAPLDAHDGLWLGGVWEWTQSAYAPYPGYRAAPGAVGEYNGKFMVNQYVLRGGSCVSPVGHLRSSYRNFFPSSSCWQFSGLRLARDGR